MLDDTHAPRRCATGAQDELSGALLALRQGAQLSQIAAVKASSVSQAKLSRIENGRALPSPDEVRALTAAYGAPIRPKPSGSLSSQLSARSSSLTPASCCRPGGRITSNSGSGKLKFGAKLVRSYRPTMVLGVLSALAYVSAVFSPSCDLSAEEAGASIASRLTRWKLLAAPDREWRLIQTEAALRWVVGSHGLMAEQLDRIIEATRLPNVRLGIIALDTVASSVAPLHSFHIYDDAPVTSAPRRGTATLLSDPAARGELRRDLRRSTSPSTTRRPGALLSRIADDYRSRRSLRSGVSCVSYKRRISSPPCCSSGRYLLGIVSVRGITSVSGVTSHSCVSRISSVHRIER